MVQRAIVPFRSEKTLTKEIIEQIKDFRLYDSDKKILGFGKISKWLKIEGELFCIGYIKYKEELLLEDFDIENGEIVEKSNKIPLIHKIPFMVKENSNFILFKKMKSHKFIKELSDYLFGDEDTLDVIRFDLKKLEDCVITQGKHSICKHKYIQKNSRIKNKIEGGDEINKEIGEYKTCGEVQKEYLGLEMDIDGLITVIVNENGYFLLFKTWKDILEEQLFVYKIWEELKEFHLILTSNPSV